MQQQLNRRYVFGEFTLDTEERQLFRAGVPVSLQPKILETLLLLLENAGHLVEKDAFMKRVWPGTFVSEEALTRNISVLRKTLGESADSQSFIATVPTRGYRFVAPVQAAEESDLRATVKLTSNAVGFSSDASDVGQSAMVKAWPPRVSFIALVLGLGSLAGLVTFYLLSPAPVPRVLRTVQLTHSGRVDAWISMVSDGSRIYFNERAGDHWNLVQTSVAGGDSQVINAPFPNTVIRDISPDHASFLIGTFEHRYAPMPLWIWPVQGGAPRRVGDITAHDAAWCPNGRQIVYTQDDGIYLANTDGSNPHKFLSIDGDTGMFSWSPNGRVLRFVRSLPGIRGSTIWEVHSDGTSLRRLIPGWNELPDEWGGSWTPDGRYFLFHSTHAGSRDIWAIQEGGALFRRRQMEPIRLTAGPTDYTAPLVSSDGHRVFVYGSAGKSEYVRYDLKSRQFVPILSGLRARGVAFSQDGQWVAYASWQDFSVVRMRPDGTQQLVVAPSSLETDSPRWSPDGEQITFESMRSNGTRTILVVSAGGGTPTELVTDDRNEFDPMWSPDGKLLALAREEAPSANGNRPPSIHVFNRATGQLAPVPGSEGLRAPSWSPDGRSMAAKSADEHRLMLLNLGTQKWKQIAKSNLIFGSPWWSKDGECIYYQDLLVPGEPVYCFHPDTNKQEVVVTFEQFLQGSATRAAFLGPAPDGSLLDVLSINDSDIYALDLALP